MHKVRCSLLAMALAGAAASVATVPVANADRLPAPRHVVVRVAASGVHAPDSLPAGRVRMQIGVPRHSPGILVLAKPDRGYTLADYRADAGTSRSGRHAANRRIRQHVRIFGGAFVRPGGTGALWETLYAGRYWLFGFTNAGRTPIETVQVHGAPSPSRFPRVTASAATTDNAVNMTRSVPQSGRMLIRNTSSRIDNLVLLPLAKGATYEDYIRWVHHPRTTTPIGRLAMWSTVMLSPHVGYVMRYHLSPGRYVVTKPSLLGGFFRGHRVDNLRQVVRPLTVRRTAVEASRTRVQAFRSVSPVRGATEGWLTPRARRLLEDSGLAAAMPGTGR